jgi:hypothetical protein
MTESLHHERASRRLIKRASHFNVSRSRLGVALPDIPHIPITDDYRNELLECLRSEEFTENGWGLFFCNGIIAGGKSEHLGEEIATLLVTRVPDWITHTDTNLRIQAIPIFISYSQFFPRFREELQKALLDPSPEIRILALANAKRFVSVDRIDTLFTLQSDPFASELSVGGKATYVLRNMAFEAIEGIVNKRFNKVESSESREGRLIYWWSWGPLLKWYSRSRDRKPWHVFGRKR